jgi:site-specific DNA-methyltransferase (adenine-specific)/adenine-specific DNA-methyltransferase
VGNTQEAKKELLEVCDFEDSGAVFITPKPTRLLHRIIEIGSDNDSLILDSFAGSGTTAHAVLDTNKADGGNRRFILVEMENDICRNVTAQRIERVIKGYNNTPGLGGGFRYCMLGEPLFDESGNIRKTVTFPDLAAHVFFTETGAPIPKAATGRTPFLGAHNGKAIYLLYNGVLHDKRPNGGNVLTNDILRGLPEHACKDGIKIIYGEGCRLSSARLKREGIIFKQVPYEIKVS